MERYPPSVVLAIFHAKEVYVTNQAECHHRLRPHTDTKLIRGKVLEVQLIEKNMWTQCADFTLGRTGHYTLCST